MNLTLAWILTIVDSEDWDRDYKPILTKGFDDFRLEREALERWDEPDEEGKGSFTLVRKDDGQPRKINMGTIVGPAIT